jgi:lipopolysaccharide biosynthesis regulator YciM
VHAEAETRLKEELNQALLREEILKGQLEFEKNASKLADSQLNVGVQRIEDFSNRLQKVIEENEEYNVVTTEIARVVSESPETQASKTLQDQLRKLPNLVRVFLKKNT